MPEKFDLDREIEKVLSTIIFPKVMYKGKHEDVKQLCKDYARTQEITFHERFANNTAEKELKLKSENQRLRELLKELLNTEQIKDIKKGIAYCVTEKSNEIILSNRKFQNLLLCIDKIKQALEVKQYLKKENAELKKEIKYKMDDYKLHIEGVYVEKYADVNKELKAKLLSCESELAEKDKYILKLKKEIAKYYNEKI